MNFSCPPCVFLSFSISLSPYPHISARTGNTIVAMNAAAWRNAQQGSVSTWFAKWSAVQFCESASQWRGERISVVEAIHLRPKGPRPFQSGDE